MGRATHILPLPLRGLKFNVKTGLYEIAQGDSSFHLNYSQVNEVKVFFSRSGETDFSLDRWYNSLSSFAKKSINRTGNVEKDNNGFYPDE